MNYKSFYFYHCKYLCFIYYVVASKATEYNLDANKKITLEWIETKPNIQVS